MIKNIKQFFTKWFLNFDIEKNNKLDKEEIKALEKKTKAEIEKVGRKIGVELDKRLTKAKLISQIKKHNK